MWRRGKGEKMRSDVNVARTKPAASVEAFCEVVGIQNFLNAGGKSEASDDLLTI